MYNLKNSQDLNVHIDNIWFFLNNVSNGPYDSEMYEIIPSTSNEGNPPGLQQCELNTSNNIPIIESNRRHLFSHPAFPRTAPRKSISIHQQFSQLKNKISNKIKNNGENEQDKNRGYLMVEKSETGLIVLPNDSIDQELTQYAQSCVHMDELSFDPSQIQCSSNLLSTPNFLTTQQQFFGICTASANDYFNDILTQPNTECCILTDDLLNIHDTRISETILSQSFQSTNDSNDAYAGVDRSTLSNEEYIRAQESDLRRLTMLDLELSKKLDSLNDESESEAALLDRLFDEGLKKNLDLQRELKKLQEIYELMFSPWTCKFCTLINEPYIQTRNYICVSCDSPSPLRQVHDDATDLNSDTVLVQSSFDVAQTDDHQTLHNTHDHMIQSMDSDLQNETPMNLLPADKHPFWQSSAENRTSIEDTPQLEYDEHDIHLIADREIDDDYELEYALLVFCLCSPHDSSFLIKIVLQQDLHFDNHQHGDFALNNDSNIRGDITAPTLGYTSQKQGIMKGNITSDGIIDDDFESELGGRETTEFHDTEDVDYHLMQKIADYGIIELCGEDKFGRKTIVCSACRLPHEDIIKNSEFKTVNKFYDCLLKYILTTFDQYVDMDYVIVYFHHGLCSYNRPAYGWLLSAYFHIDRKYKKNLKALYIVHPTKWIKFLWPFLRSIISSKFSSKVIYINRLGQLVEYVHMENIKIPTEVKYIDPIIPIPVPPLELNPSTKFHVSLQFLLDHEHGATVPVVIRETIDYVKSCGLNEPGIFRRTTSVSLIKKIQEKYNA
ncbi:unnamed protein product, partial [Rotaria socialis]